jgi:hypothetical protein
MSTIRWQLTVSLELDKAVRIFIDRISGDYRQNLAHLTKAAVQELIASRDYKNYPIGLDNINGEKLSGVINWEVSVFSGLNESAQMIITQKNNEFAGSLSRLIEQSIRRYLFKYKIQRFAETVSKFSKTELEDLIEYCGNLHQTARKK